jgi:hypothetical protein
VEASETGAQLVKINYGRINYTVTIIVSLFSSIIPLLAIIAMYYVKGTPRRLAVAAGFTIGFAFAVVILTRTKKSEIFAAVVG